jgi:hypothetical protein
VAGFHAESRTAADRDPSAREVRERMLPRPGTVCVRHEAVRPRSAWFRELARDEGHHHGGVKRCRRLARPSPRGWLEPGGRATGSVLERCSRPGVRAGARDAPTGARARREIFTASCSTSRTRHAIASHRDLKSLLGDLRRPSPGHPLRPARDRAARSGARSGETSHHSLVRADVSHGPRSTRR